MAPRRSERWKALERTAADKLGGRRVHRRLFEKAPDVIVEDLGMVIECKAYSKFAHHSLIEVAQNKYAEGGEVVALVTKASGQRGEYVTVPLDWLADILDMVRAIDRRAV